MPSSPSIVILGGGVFGLTAGLQLHSRGWQVTLLEQGSIPHPDAASTDISKVVRMDYGGDLLHTELGEQSIKGWRTWSARWGEPLYHETGFLLMCREPMQPEGFEYDSYELLTQREWPLRRLDSAVLAAEYPQWNHERYTAGYYNPSGGWVESGRVVARLKQEALHAGIALHENVPLPRVALDEGPAIVAKDGRRWEADRCLVAAGAWTPIVLPHLQPVLWATGQPVVHFRPADPVPFQPPQFPVWGADIARTGWYGFPANADGVVKIANHGSGRRMRADEPRAVDPSEERRFRAFLRENLPALADAPLVGTRLCLYCDTFDGAFWIDHDPGHPGLIVAAGDSGHAFKFAPVLGSIIADVVEQKPNRFAERYRWREAKAMKADGARAVG